LTGFQELQGAIEPLYEPVRTKYENWMKAQKRTLAKAVQECITIEAQNATDIRSYIQSVLCLFEEQCLQRISVLDETVLWEDPKTLIDAKVALATQQLVQKIGTMLTPMSLHVTMANRTVTVAKDYETTRRECVVQGHATVDYVYPITYDLLVPLYKIWTDWTRDSPQIGALVKAVTDRKKALLFQALVGDDVTRRIKDVDFVELGLHGMRMTVETFRTCYMPLVHRAIQQMDEKGYLVEGDAEDFVRVKVRICNEKGITSQALPWSFAKMHHLEIETIGNIVATVFIGSHGEPALVHLFKNVHSEVVALERAKKTGSLYVGVKHFA